MIVWNQHIYRSETGVVVETFPGAGADQLPFIRHGVVVGSSTVPNKLGIYSGPPFSLVVCYMAVSAGEHRPVHRIGYLRCVEPKRDLADDYDGSDNLILPTTFAPGRYATVKPTKFGMADSGPVGNLKLKWLQRLQQANVYWSQRFRNLSVRPPGSNQQLWGRDYESFVI